MFIIIVVIIIRSTIPGHNNCYNLEKPFSSEEEAEKYIIKNNNNHVGNILNNITIIKQQNNISKYILNEYNINYLDVIGVIFQRGDSHVGKNDCLHYCVPGPFFVIVDYLFDFIFKKFSSFL